MGNVINLEEIRRSLDSLAAGDPILKEYLESIDRSEKIILGDYDMFIKCTMCLSEIEVVKELFLNKTVFNNDGSQDEIVLSQVIRELLTLTDEYYLLAINEKGYKNLEKKVVEYKNKIYSLALSYEKLMNKIVKKRYFQDN